MCYCEAVTVFMHVGVRCPDEAGRKRTGSCDVKPGRIRSVILEMPLQVC